MTPGAARGAPRRRALVVSPTPTHPVDHGHRNRVRQTTGLLARAGYAVDFVLYPMDDDWRAAIPPALAEMQAAWGHGGGMVSVVPPSRALHAPPAGAHHAIDEWWDPALDAQIDFLVRRRRYDAMLVNYVFLSRALLHAPPRCRRVLDTHDRLSGRGALFARNGAPPEFFSTTEAEEAKGLARADLVLAIKQSEADFFRTITSRNVLTLPFAPKRRKAAPARPSDTTALRVGFIGADNTVNAANLAAFLRRLALWHGLYLPDLAVRVAGNVCRRIAQPPPFVTLLGRVEDAGAFYADVDVVVAPLAFSTGLKIKVAEALGRGMAVVATADAFDGFPPRDALHTLPDLDAVCGALVMLAADRGRLAALTTASRRAAAAAARAASRAGTAWLAALAAPARRMRLVTDRDLAARATLADERCWQAMRYFADLMDVVVEAPGAETGADTPIWQDLRGARPRLLNGGDRFDPSPPPLRHLPQVLGWEAPGRAGTALALVVVETRQDATEAAATSALAAALCAACAPYRVAVLHTRSVAEDPVFLATLATLPRPLAVIGVDLGEAARELLRCLAALASSAYFGLGDPYPLWEGDGLVCHPREHIAAIGDWLRAPGPPSASEATHDAGWSVLWARLSRTRLFDGGAPL